MVELTKEKTFSILYSRKVSINFFYNFPLLFEVFRYTEKYSLFTVVSSSFNHSYVVRMKNTVYVCLPFPQKKKKNSFAASEKKRSRRVHCWLKVQRFLSNVFCLLYIKAVVFTKALYKTHLLKGWVLTIKIILCIACWQLVIQEECVVYKLEN